jgi:hypothetical protein
MSGLTAALAVGLLIALVAPLAVAAAPVGSESVGPARDVVSQPSAIQPGSVGRTSLDLRTTYSATVRLSYATRRFSVHSAATITNTSGGPIDRIELNTAAARLGSMRLTSALVDGHAVAAKVSDQTILVPLGGILPAGATTVVRIKYSSTLRTSTSGSSWLFTKARGIVDAYRWLPWVSRRTPFDRPNHGDPFVTPTSPFVRLTVITDRRLVIVTTGDRVYRSSDGRTQRFEARDVRDMTLTAAPDFHSRSTKVGSTTIRYYYRSSTSAATILAAAADAFRAMEARLGDYPYPTFKVVQSAGGYGMESPRLIWIPYGTTSSIRYLVAHETAHQWFYGLVGNDQARQPFVDEAAADFVARYVTGTKRASRCPAGRLDSASSARVARKGAELRARSRRSRCGRTSRAPRRLNFCQGPRGLWSANSSTSPARRVERVSAFRRDAKPVVLVVVRHCAGHKPALLPPEPTGLGATRPPLTSSCGLQLEIRARAG